jgi:hypothetical protein
MTDLGAGLANCPNRRSSAHGERCDVFFPGLAAPSCMATIVD